MDYFFKDAFFFTMGCKTFCQRTDMCYMSYSPPVSPSQTDIEIRLYTRSSQSDSESRTVFISSLFEFIVIRPVLGPLALHLVFRGLTFHILCHSAHCSFNRWLISCLNSHQTQHAISASINSPELMNTIAAFLGKTFHISERIYRDPEILGKWDENNMAVFSHCLCHD